MTPLVTTVLSVIGLVLVLVAWILPAESSGASYLVPDQPGEVWSVTFLGLTLRLLGILAGVSFGVSLLWQDRRRAFGAGFLIGLGIPFLMYVVASAFFVATLAELEAFPADYVRPVAAFLIVVAAVVSLHIRGVTGWASSMTNRGRSFVVSAVLTIAGTALAATAVWWEGASASYHWFHLEFLAAATCLIIAVSLRGGGTNDLARGLVVGAGVDLILRVPTELDAAINFPDPIAAAAAIVLALAGSFAIFAGGLAVRETSGSGYQQGKRTPLA